MLFAFSFQVDKKASALEHCFTSLIWVLFFLYTYFFLKRLSYKFENQMEGFTYLRKTLLHQLRSVTEPRSSAGCKN